MSLAKLVFKLPDEELEFRRALNGSNYHAALWEFSEETLRKIRKYRELTEEQQKLFDEIDEAFSTVLREFKIELFDEM